MTRFYFLIMKLYNCNTHSFNAVAKVLKTTTKTNVYEIQSVQYLKCIEVFNFKNKHKKKLSLSIGFWGFAPKINRNKVARLFFKNNKKNY